MTHLPPAQEPLLDEEKPFDPDAPKNVLFLIGFALVLGFIIAGAAVFAFHTLLGDSGHEPERANTLRTVSYIEIASSKAPEGTPLLGHVTSYDEIITPGVVLIEGNPVPFGIAIDLQAANLRRYGGPTTVDVAGTVDHYTITTESAGGGVLVYDSVTEKFTTQ